MLLSLLVAPLAGAAEPLWVEAPTADDRARARAAGLAWAEGQEGGWYLLDGTPAMAEAAGLRWRRESRFLSPGTLTAADVVTRMDALGGGTRVQLGESVRGAPILAVRFGAGGRALRVLGGHHGDEESSVEVALRLAEAVASGAVTLPEDTELWVVPLVNPDGLDTGTRTNANGVDLNRNYGWEWSPDEPNSGDAPFSEPETRAVRALARARSFDAGLSLHSGAQNIGWVWNWTAETRPVEEPLLADLADAYAAACDAPDFWITNGADWYETRGDTTDWTYGAWGAYDFTLELTVDKSPPAEEVATYVAWHLDALVAWLARPADARGVLLDAVTGEPIPGVVSGDTALHPLSTGPGGAAARWLAADAGPLVASAPGYASTPFDGDTRLSPTSLLAALPTPRLLSRGGPPVRVTLPGTADQPLSLWQPGEGAFVTVPSDGAGAWTIDPTTLAPGAWTIVTREGTIPRALFVGEVDDRVVLTATTLADGALTLDGAGFATGAEAWSIGGPARALHPLVRVSESPDRLVFALASPDDDVLVWANGAWLSAVNLHTAPEVDPTPPSADAPVADAPAEDATLRAAGACAAGPAGGGGIALATSLALVAGRRRRWEGITEGRALVSLPDSGRYPIKIGRSRWRAVLPVAMRID